MFLTDTWVLSISRKTGRSGETERMAQRYEYDNVLCLWRRDDLPVLLWVARHSTVPCAARVSRNANSNSPWKHKPSHAIFYSESKLNLCEYTVFYALQKRIHRLTVLLSSDGSYFWIFDFSCNKSVQLKLKKLTKQTNKLNKPNIKTSSWLWTSCGML